MMMYLNQYLITLTTSFHWFARGSFSISQLVWCICYFNLFIIWSIVYIISYNDRYESNGFENFMSKSQRTFSIFFEHLLIRPITVWPVYVLGKLYQRAKVEKKVYISRFEGNMCLSLVLRLLVLYLVIYKLLLTFFSALKLHCFLTSPISLHVDFSFPSNFCIKFPNSKFCRWCCTKSQNESAAFSTLQSCKRCSWSCKDVNVLILLQWFFYFMMIFLTYSAFCVIL